MINISRLVAGQRSFGDRLRYVRGASRAVHGTAAGSGPVVVWNCTRRCNLSCVHCYASAVRGKNENELSTEEAKKMIDGLAEMKVPVLLVSGGEPLVREDIIELSAYASEKGIRVTFSTNGTLITPDKAEKIKETGVGYVGISIDGRREIHDRFRGQEGAFDKAMQGIRNCLAVGQKVGIRFTVNRSNYEDIPYIFEIMDREGIDRVCFYHLVYQGRGDEIRDADISAEEKREFVRYLMEKAKEYGRQGRPMEILTVDNHCDGPFIYLETLRNDPEKAPEVLRLLNMNGGNRSGAAFAEIDWEGVVHPDQFSMNIPLGSIRERSFREIWTDSNNEFLSKMRNRREILGGRCRECRWLGVCNGNFRPRAEAVYGDYWMEDPACYLTDDEIGKPGEADEQ